MQANPHKLFAITLSLTLIRTCFTLQLCKWCVAPLEECVTRQDLEPWIMKARSISDRTLFRRKCPHNHSIHCGQVCVTRRISLPPNSVGSSLFDTNTTTGRQTATSSTITYPNPQPSKKVGVTGRQMEPKKCHPPCAYPKQLCLLLGGGFSTRLVRNKWKLCILDYHYSIFYEY